MNKQLKFSGILVELLKFNYGYGFGDGNGYGFSSGSGYGHGDSYGHGHGYGLDKIGLNGLEVPCTKKIKRNVK